MRKALFAFLISFSLFLYSAGSVFAENSFSTDYTVNYNVSSNSNTKVSLNAVLTNLTDKYYASSYSIEVGFTDIKNLSASDSEGNISPKITKNVSGSTITLTFNKQVVGLNSKLHFNISFDTNEVAQNFNNTWDINIPGISPKNDFLTFNVTVNYPQFLGKPTFIKPKISQNFQQSVGKLFFTKEELGKSGISVSFGNFQIYNLNLKYHLENKNLFPVSTEIALPPNTNYQEISIEQINPKPLNVTIDKDGNWLARYNLNSSKVIEVMVLAKAKVFINPKNEKLDKSLKNSYLSPQKYWDSKDAKIINLAKELKTPYAIYKYVVSALKYDFSRVETQSPRLGSLLALENPNSAVCLEFTDLFIAIARAAGIPAREVDGYAYTSNTAQRPLSLVKDILHAWPEYYDFERNSWVMVDPTWGNTTGGVDYFNVLDFDHVAFVIKGQNSNYPVPAGGYKLANNQNSKDIDIEIGNSFVTKPVSLTKQIYFPSEVIAGLPSNGFVKIQNLGSTVIGRKEINVSTNILKPNKQSIFTNDLPPFGYQLINLSFERTPLLTNKEDTIKIADENTTIYKNVKIIPFFVNKMFILGGLLLVTSIIFISAIAYISRRLYVLRQKKRSDLRGQSDKP